MNNINSSKQTEVIYDHPIRCKKCSHCNIFKQMFEFNNDKSRKDGKHHKCKKCRSEYAQEHKEQLREYKAKYYIENKESINIKNRENYILHKEERSEKAKIYRKNNAEKISQRKKERYEQTYVPHPKVLLSDEERERRKKERKKKYEETHKEEIREGKRKYNHTKRGMELNKKQCRKYYYNNIDKVRAYWQTPQAKLNQRGVNHRRRMQKAATPKEHKLTLSQWEKILKAQNNKCAVCGIRFTEDNPPTEDHIKPLSKGGEHTSINIQALCRSCNSSKGAKEALDKIQSWL